MFETLFNLYIDLALVLVSLSYCLASVLSSPLTYNIFPVLPRLHSCPLLLIRVLDLRVASSTLVTGHLARNQEGAPELSCFVLSYLFRVDCVPDVRCWTYNKKQDRPGPSLLKLAFY